MKRKHEFILEETYKFSKCKTELISIENELLQKKIKELELKYEKLFKDKILYIERKYNDFIIGKMETINMSCHDINVNINIDYISDYDFYS